MKASTAILLSLATASCASHSLPPPAPPSPWLVDAYIGYQPNPSMSAETPGDIWYYKNALQIDGESISLTQSPVVCRNGQLSWSSSDGGFYSYKGVMSGDQHFKTAQFTFVGCDYCIVPEPRTGKFAPFVLPISFPSPGVARLGDIEYQKGIASDDRTCPP